MKEISNIKCPKKGFRLESKFTTWWLGEIGKKGYWKKKWSDASQDLKPYDCNIATDIDDYYCEVKMIKKDEFHFGMFRPNQIKALEELTRLGRKAIVCIYSIEHNQYNVYLYKELKKTLQTEKN